MKVDSGSSAVRVAEVEEVPLSVLPEAASPGGGPGGGPAGDHRGAGSGDGAVDETELVDGARVTEEPDSPGGGSVCELPTRFLEPRFRALGSPSRSWKPDLPGAGAAGAIGNPDRAAQRLAAMRSGGASAGRAAASAWP